MLNIAIDIAYGLPSRTLKLLPAVGHVGAAGDFLPAVVWPAFPRVVSTGYWVWGSPQ